MSGPPALVVWMPGWTAGLLAPVVVSGCGRNATASKTNTASSTFATVALELRVRGASFIFLSLRSARRYAHNYGAPASETDRPNGPSSMPILQAEAREHKCPRYEPRKTDAYSRNVTAPRKR